MEIQKGPARVVPVSCFRQVLLSLTRYSPKLELTRPFVIIIFIVSILLNPHAIVSRVLTYQTSGQTFWTNPQFQRRFKARIRRAIGEKRPYLDGVISIFGASWAFVVVAANGTIGFAP